MRARAVKCKTISKAAFEYYEGHHNIFIGESISISLFFLRCLGKLLMLTSVFFPLPSVLSLLAGVASVEIFVDGTSIPIEVTPSEYRLNKLSFGITVMVSCW